MESRAHGIIAFSATEYRKKKELGKLKGKQLVMWFSQRAKLLQYYNSCYIESIECLKYQIIMQTLKYFKNFLFSFKLKFEVTGF